MMRYEFKKLFERRLNVLAMLLGYILIILCVFIYLAQEHFYDEKTGSHIEGMEALRLNQERANKLTDIITEEYVTGLIEEIQNRNMDLESDEAYKEIIRPIGEMFWFVSKNYTDMREANTDLGALNKVDLTDGARFYESRMEKISNFLNCDFSFGNYKEIEKEYWLKKAADTNIPFRWGSMSVMDDLLIFTSMMLYLQVVIIICASSVFSYEYESGAASLLLTTKHGKDKMIHSKIAVTLLFTVGYLTGGALIAIALTALLTGLPGADLPIQLWNSVIPYNLTAWQTCLCTTAVNLLIGITITLVLLCCSAWLRSSFVTLVIGAAIMFAPACFSMSRESGIWNHINYLFPIRVFDFRSVIGSYVSYTIGDVVIPYVAMIVIVYAVIGSAALLLTKRGFVKAG